MKKHFSAIWKSFLKRWPIIAICTAVIAASYFILFNHYRNFRFGREDFVYKIESKLLDTRFKIRGPQKTTGKIGILAIDEKTLSKFGDYPFSRKYYERVYDNLKALGVKWIGFDAVYVEKEKAKLIDVKDEVNVLKSQPKNTSNMVQKLESYLVESPADINLARGIKNFQNIVLGYFFYGSKTEAQDNLGNSPNYYEGLDPMLSSAINFDIPEGKKLDDYYQVVKGYGIRANHDLISSSSPHFAFFSNDADDDAIMRWVTLVANVDGNLMPSLALKTVAETMNRDVMVFFDDFGIDKNIALVNREDSSDAIEVPIDPLGAGRILVNHRGPGKTFRHYSIADAYDNTFTEKEKEALKGSTLLLGATATGTNDLRPNVFDPAIDGVENHAAVMDNILAKDFLKRPVDIFKTELLIVLFVGLLFAPLMIWGKALTSGIAVALFLSGYLAFDYYVWFLKGTWAFVAVPSVEIIGMFLATTLYKYMTEEKEKRQVKGAFQHYLSPDVINQVLDDPASLKLGGERKEITVFFSDVRGFTTISETLSPEKLCEFMNEYFTPMTAIILESGGVLDKYIGDAIMAFWGAPISIPNHADKAAEATLKMWYALDKCNVDFPKKNFPKFDIGMGLNTGPMSVGNMGSHVRFSYTVMGDSVNLGSRLESLTKEYGIKIMMSEATKSKLTPNKYVLRELDDITVKGKNEPVKVFELIKPDLLPENVLKNFLGEFEAGRTAYLAQKWDVAEKHFVSSLQLRTSDKASELFLKRIETFKKEAPGENWDGVYRFKHK